MFALLPVFACGVCVLWCVLAWGWWDNHCPAAPASLAWLVLTLWCGLEKRVREPVGGQVWGGTIMSRPLRCWVVLPPLRARGREKIEGGGARSEW